MSMIWHDLWPLAIEILVQKYGAHQSPVHGPIQSPSFVLDRCSFIVGELQNGSSPHQQSESIRYGFPVNYVTLCDNISRKIAV